MYGQVILGLLATAICVHSNVSEHYFVKKGNSNFTCNWTVQIVCNNSSLIDIHNVTVLYTSCNGSCTTCADSFVSTSSTAVFNTTIHSQILDKCNHQASCVTPLPDPVVSGNKNITHVTVYFNCTNTDTPTTKKDSGTTVSVFSSPTTYAAGISENITGIDTNTDTSPSKRNEATVIVTSSPATQADDTSSEDPDTVIQPSSLNVVSAVVPTVLVLVAITVVTVVIIARRHTGVNDAKLTTNKSDDSIHELPENGTCVKLVAPTYEQLLRQIDNTDYSYIVGSSSAVLIQEFSTGDPQSGKGSMYSNVVETMYEELSGDRSDMTYSDITGK